MARRKRSTARKLVQVAALAALLVLVGSVAAEATPIMISYSGPGGPETGFFKWGTGINAYAFELTFQQTNGPFDVTVNAVENPSLTGRLGAFPGYTCVPIKGGTSCVEFEVTAPPSGPTTWTGFFDIFINWNFDTNTLYPNTPGNRIRILHNLGSVPENAFDTDITTPGSYCPYCGLDAGIGGTDDNFQSFIVVQAPIPEPATLLLLGSGLSALLYRQRRRRQES